MSYRTFRILAALFALALVYAGMVSRIRDHERFYFAMFLLCGFQLLVALGLGTVRDDGGWRLRFWPISLCLLVQGSVSVWDERSLSPTQIAQQLSMLPVVWLALSAMFDLSGQPATNFLLRGYRRTASILRSPILLIVGSALVIFGVAFGRGNQNEWVTSSSWVSWNADLPTAIRNYAGTAVFFAITAAAGLTLLTLAVLIGNRNRLAHRMIHILAFVVFVICSYAAADAGFAASGLIIGDTPGLREIYIAWGLFEVIALAYVISDFSRFGHVRRQTVIGLGLIIVPQVQLAMQICLSFLIENGWNEPDNFVMFYLGVGLLLWAFARMVIAEPAPLTVEADASPELKTLAATV